MLCLRHRRQRSRRPCKRRCRSSLVTSQTSSSKRCTLQYHRRSHLPYATRRCVQARDKPGVRLRSMCQSPRRCCNRSFIVSSARVRSRDMRSLAGYYAEPAHTGAQRRPRAPGGAGGRRAGGHLPLCVPCQSGPRYWLFRWWSCQTPVPSSCHVRQVACI
jgi:hypothetical protein